MVPGGINVLLTMDSFENVCRLSAGMLDYVKKLVAVQEDVTSFSEDAKPEGVAAGARAANLICLGRYDDVDVYDGTYARLDGWAGRRSIPAVVILDDHVRTGSLRALNLGIEEFVDHAFYDMWSGHAITHDPVGGPVSPFHPWNRETKPRPEGCNWKERYTWSTAPRWDRHVVEAGPFARNWMLAAAGKAEPWGGLLQPGGAALEYGLPAGAALPETRFIGVFPGGSTQWSGTRPRASSRNHLAANRPRTGLTICRKIVERHGGAITADSAPGAGATFTIDLPLQQPGGAER
jgi:hydrogenase large subunit